MPFPMKIQPIDCFDEPIRHDYGKPPVQKSRLKRLFDRQLPSVLRISSAISEKPTYGFEQPVPTCSKDQVPEFEPSSVCLAKMVKDFIEETHDKPSAAVKCGRNRCSCFNGNNNDSSDDEFDVFGSSGDLVNSSSLGDAVEYLKSLVPSASAIERNLLADTAKIIDSNKISKRKDDLRIIVTNGLSALGYNVSICKSRWDKSPSYPAGEYEYIDATIAGERLLIDIDLRSEFEIARSTGNYKTLLQSVPSIFVGKPDRLQQIVSILSEAVKQSLTKKGMHFPPWRKAEYMIAKWLSPYTRTTAPSSLPSSSTSFAAVRETENKDSPVTDEIEYGELELIFGELTPPSKTDSGIFSESSPARSSLVHEKKTPMLLSPWQLPAIKPKSFDRGSKVVTGLAFLLTENP